MLKFFGAVYIILCVHPIIVLAQKKYEIKITSSEFPSSFFSKYFDISKKYNDTLAVSKQLNKGLQKLYFEGYLNTHMSKYTDTVNNVVFVDIFPDKQYKWLKLTNGNIDESIISQVHFQERYFSEKPFYYKELVRLQESVLKLMENNGYPFAKIWLDSIVVQEEEVAAKLYLGKNNLIYIDTIQKIGDASIAMPFLYRYLGLYPGDIYDESIIKKVGTRLDALAYLAQEKPFSIFFIDNNATINLFLKEKQASRFNFLLGILPNNQQTGKLLITGDADLQLQNVFNRGEFIGLNWERLQTNTQTLAVKMTYPYLFNSLLGVDADFNLYRRDTTFLELIQHIGLQYLFAGGNYLKAYIGNKTSTILSVDTTSIIASKKLPSNIDIANRQYGLEYNWQKLDYRYNPRKGYWMVLNGMVGTKTIKKNSKIISLKDPLDIAYDFNSLYDSLLLKTNQYQLQVKVEGYTPFGKSNVIKLAINGSSIIGQNIFKNELFRIGGHKLLRGFNEQSIQASSYVVATLEWRYLLQKNSYVYLFTDAAYTESKTVEGNIFETPVGFGTGIAFETSSGVFSLSYAYGGFDYKIDFRSAKIHFGYVNYF